MESDSFELECRICRGNSEEGRPLYHPCKCNGSIGLVHQDCLEAWLEHSNKDRCELCSVKYTFVPIYDQDAPEVLPITLVMRSFLKFLFSQAVPMMFRGIFVAAVWLGFVPVSTLCFYKTFMRSNTTWGLDTLLTYETICYGLVLDALIALSLLIIMSFTDFIRFHWVPEQPVGQAPLAGGVGIADPARNNNNNNNNNANAPPAGIPNPQAMPGVFPEQPQRVFGENVMRLRRRRAAPERRGNEGVVPRQGINEEEDREAEDDRDEDAVVDEEDEWEDIADDLANPAAQVPVPPPAIPPHAPAPFPVGDAANFAFGDDPPNLPNNMEMRVALLELLGVVGSPLVALRNALWIVAFISLFIFLALSLPRLLGALVVKVSTKRVFSVVVALSSRAQELWVQSGWEAWVSGVWVKCCDGMWLGLKDMDWVEAENAQLSVTLSTLLNPFVAYLMAPMQPLIAAAPQLPTLLTLAYEYCREHDLPLYYTDLLLLSLGYTVLSCQIFLLAYVVHSIPLAGGGGGVGVVHENGGVRGGLANVLTPYLTSLAYLQQLLVQLCVVVKVSILLCMRIFLLPMVIGILLVALAAPALPYNLEAYVHMLAAQYVTLLGACWGVGISFMLVCTVSILQWREILHPSFLAKIIRPQEAHLDLIQSLITESSVAHTVRMATSFTVYFVLLLLFGGVPLCIYRAVVAAGWMPPLDFQFWYHLPILQAPLELLIGHLYFLSVLDAGKDGVGKWQYAMLKWGARKLGLTTYLLPHNREPASPFARNSAGGHRRPVLRPPRGWDTLSAVQSTRWAWRGETASALELELLPPSAPPSFLFLRLFILLGGVYLVLLSTLLGVAFVPFYVGRALGEALYLPDMLQHDPLLYLIGLKLLSVMATVVITLLRYRLPSVLPPSPYLVKVVKWIGMRVMSYYGAGCLMTFVGEMALSPASPLLNSLENWPSLTFSGSSSLVGLYAPLYSTSTLYSRAPEDSLGWEEIPWEVGLIVLRGMLVVEGGLYMAYRRVWGVITDRVPLSGMLRLWIGGLLRGTLRPPVVPPSATLNAFFLAPFVAYFVKGWVGVGLAAVFVEGLLVWGLGLAPLVARYLFIHCALLLLYMGVALFPFYGVFVDVVGQLGGSVYTHIRNDYFLRGRKLVNL